MTQTSFNKVSKSLLKLINYFPAYKNIYLQNNKHQDIQITALQVYQFKMRIQLLKLNQHLPHKNFSLNNNTKYSISNSHLHLISIILFYLNNNNNKKQIICLLIQMFIINKEQALKLHLEVKQTLQETVITCKLIWVAEILMVIFLIMVEQACYHLDTLQVIVEEMCIR